MRILLVSPEYSDSRLKFTKKEVRAFWFPRLSCVTIAALTPPEHDVVFIDEAVDTIPLHEHFDVVGISVMTAMAHRAYEIADHFQSRGAKVVLGGMHPTALPVEGLQHADAVVIGEAEELWAPLLADVARGHLQPIYKADRFPPTDLSGSRRFVAGLGTAGGGAGACRPHASERRGDGSWRLTLCVGKGKKALLSWRTRPASVG
jgi:hypothetical protein